MLVSEEEEFNAKPENEEETRVRVLCEESYDGIDQ